MIQHFARDPWEMFPVLIGGFIVVFSLISMVIKEWLFLSEASKLFFLKKIHNINLF